MKIPHLDDHSIILNAFRDVVLKIDPQPEVRSYSSTDEVLSEIAKSLVAGERIDLFVTDFMHYGPNGYELCKVIRSLERGLQRTPMPILLYTMYAADLREIQDGLKEEVFTSYLSIASSGREEITFAVLELLKRQL